MFWFRLLLHGSTLIVKLTRVPTGNVFVDTMLLFKYDTAIAV